MLIVICMYTKYTHPQTRIHQYLVDKGENLINTVLTPSAMIFNKDGFTDTEGAISGKRELVDNPFDPFE